MSEKTEHEMIELLWGITDKLDKLLDLIGKLAKTSPVQGDSGFQMSISPPTE